jgi:serine protease
MSLSKVVGAVAALLAAVGAIVATQNQVPGFKTMIADIGLQGIDTGLWSAGLPNGPRTRSYQFVDRSSSPARLRDSIIVKFKDGVAAASQRAMLVHAGASTAMGTPTYSDFNIVTLGDGTNPELAVQDLAAQPDVEYAQPRHHMHPTFVPNDPLYSMQWNYPAIDMEHAWDLNAGASSSIIVAVLDTGVAFQNAVFRYRAAGFTIDDGLTKTSFPALGTVDVPFAAAPDLGGSNRFVSPHDFIWDDNSPVDTDGHGTHVSGTIGQLTNNGVGAAGMAFNVRIMPVKVIDSDWDFIFNSPETATDDVVARGIRYAVDNGAKVLNMSFGENDGPSPVMEEAIAYAVAHGAFLAIAAGNEFETGNPTSWPAAYAPKWQGAVAVGAIGRDRQRAFYSNTGSYVELVAPGGNDRVGGTQGGILQQTYNLDFVETFLSGPSGYRAPRFDIFQYQFFEGTSMAAPHVAGFAALLLQQGITSPAAIEAAMEQFATDLGPPGRDNQYGYGLINPRAALRGLGLAK